MMHMHLEVYNRCNFLVWFDCDNHASLSNESLHYKKACVIIKAFNVDNQTTNCLFKNSCFITGGLYVKKSLI